MNCVPLGKVHHVASREKPYVIKSSRDPFDAPTAQDAAGYMQATQLQQSAEWGMRALKGLFPNSLFQLSTKNWVNAK
jgi:hypothetical protein